MLTAKSSDAVASLYGFNEGVLMAETPLHRRLVRLLVASLERNGYRVTHAAGLDGYPHPTKVGRHEPDVIAAGKGTRVYGEARAGDGQPTLHIWPGARL